MDAYREMVSADAKAKVEQIPALIEGHLAFIRGAFTKSQADVRTELSSSPADLAAGKTNATMVALLLQLNDSLATDIEVLASLAQWIALHVPVVEDGNNFGCDVQAHVYKVIKESCTALQTTQDSLATYHNDRAGALDKVVSFPTKKVTNSSSKSNTTGGKEEEAGEKSDVSESTEESRTEKAVLQDYVEYVNMVDLKWYNKMKAAAMKMTEALAVAGDTVVKNMEKLEDPRGESGGGSKGFNMY